MAFRKDFIWGAATAAYQIEGGAYAAGKGENVWDVGSKVPGRVFEGHTGDFACDHYHRFKEDVAIMKKLGIKNYRFSINWARLMPDGVGRLSVDGVRFYSELIDELLSSGITPWVTLFHWDYPYALYKKGGWLNDDSPLWFEEYATKIAELYGDRVTHFMTVNEPQCFVELGHFQGTHAPFLKLSRAEVLHVAGNVLKASSMAERALRKTCKGDITVGFALAYAAAMPYDKEKDLEAAREESFICHGDLFGASFWTDPWVLGSFPESFKPMFRENGFNPTEEDMKIMKGNYDFVGVNSYTSYYVKYGENGKIEAVPFKPSDPLTDMRWHVCPELMYYTPKFLYERYNLPVIYTENGCAISEWKDLNGEVKDPSRIDYIKRYLRELMRAADDGVDIRGYFYWSLLDNYEWGEGYSKHFGLVHVDYDTFERTLKDSAYYYSEVISSNGEIVNK